MGEKVEEGRAAGAPLLDNGRGRSGDADGDMPLESRRWLMQGVLVIDLKEKLRL